MRVRGASEMSTLGVGGRHFLPYIKMECAALPVKLLARLSPFS